MDAKTKTQFIDSSLASGLTKRFLREQEAAFNARLKKMDAVVKRLSNTPNVGGKKYHLVRVEQFIKLFGSLLIGYYTEGKGKKTETSILGFLPHEGMLWIGLGIVRCQSSALNQYGFRISKHAIERLFQRLQTTDFHDILTELAPIGAITFQLIGERMTSGVEGHDYYEAYTPNGMAILSVHKYYLSVVTFVDKDKLRPDQVPDPTLEYNCPMRLLPREDMDQAQQLEEDMHQTPETEWTEEDEDELKALLNLEAREDEVAEVLTE